MRNPNRKYTSSQGYVIIHITMHSHELTISGSAKHIKHMTFKIFMAQLLYKAGQELRPKLDVDGRF